MNEGTSSPDAEATEALPDDPLPAYPSLEDTLATTRVAPSSVRPPLPPARVPPSGALGAGSPPLAVPPTPASGVLGPLPPVAPPPGVMPASLGPGHAMSPVPPRAAVPPPPGPSLPPAVDLSAAAPRTSWWRALLASTLPPPGVPAAAPHEVAEALVRARVAGSVAVLGLVAVALSLVIGLRPEPPGSFLSASNVAAATVLARAIVAVGLLGVGALLLRAAERIFFRA